MAALGLKSCSPIGDCRFLNPCVQPRAATEGRPYSTFRVLLPAAAEGFVNLDHADKFVATREGEASFGVE